jgi:hypothetical protein
MAHPHIYVVNESLPAGEIFQNGRVAVLCCGYCGIPERPLCCRVCEFSGEKVVFQEGVELSAYLAECARLP